MSRIKLFNEDCMSVMGKYPDKYFDYAIVDPPYGIDAGNKTFGNRKQKFEKKCWDENIPHPSYFFELKRVSKNQLIFGGNYFPLPKTNGWLFWDKDRSAGVSFSDGELAWTSFLTSLRKTRVVYDGNRGSDTNRIHPTQKPIRLYDWIYQTYIPQGAKVLDTHLGSGSSAISAYFNGVEFVGCELDKDYFDEMLQRFNEETRQSTLF